MKNFKNSRRGFTLVELLVVIVIIAALAGLAFSVSAKVRKSADEAVTTANLRQIGVALISYTAENNRFPSQQGDPVWDRCLIPLLGYSSTPTGSGGINSNDHEGLEGIAKIFASPADKETRAKGTYKRSFAIVPWTTNWSNGTSFRGWKDLPYNKGIRYSMLNAPEKAAMLVQWHEGTVGIPNVLGSGAHAYHDIGGRQTSLGNNQQVVFADGHIETLSAKMNTAEFLKKYWPGTIGSTN
jgi:prepilin-type N-terminal cleavage/methylation domain-containing protein